MDKEDLWIGGLTTVEYNYSSIANQEVSLEMELGEGSRVLQGGRRSEEHGKLGDTVGGKGKGNGIGNSAPTRASQCKA